MTKTNENPEDIVYMNVPMYRHERDAINRKAKAVGITAKRYLIELGVSGKIPKRK